MRRTFTFIATILLSLNTFAEEIKFYWGQESVSEISLSDMRKGTLAINGKTINTVREKVYNPFRKSTKSYEGYEFLSLLDQIYGPRWREADTLTFTALDGFIQSTPIKKMLEETKKHTGVIAFKEVDAEGLSSFEKNGKTINPGPAYLVWNRFDGRSVASYSDFLKWPYQLKSIKVLKIKK